MKFIELDERVGLHEQLGSDLGPVILINTLEVTADEAELLLAAWTADAQYFKRQPGFISTQLHRGIGGSSVFLNYAVWESVAHFRRAFQQPEFQRRLQAYPPSTVTRPHLFQRLTVPDVCVA